MRLIFRIMLVVFLFVCPDLVYKQARSESLLEALVDGYEYSSSVAAHLARLRRAVEAIREAEFGDDLSVDLLGSGSGGYRESYNRTSKNKSSGISMILNAELKATIPVIRPANKFDVELKRAQLVQEQYTYDQVLTQLFVDIVTSYNGVYTQQKKLSLYEEAAERAAAQVQAASERFAVGQVTRSDVAQAKALLALAKSEYLDAQTRLNLAWIGLSNLVGERYSSVEEPDIDISLPTDEKDAIEQALSNNVLIALARAAVDAGAVSVRYAESGDDLRFDLTFSLRKAHPITDAGLSETDSFSVNLGGNLVYPVYDGGRNDSQVVQSEIAYAEALERLQQARLDAEREAESVVENIVAIEALLEANEAEIVAQTVALEGVKEEEIVGTRALVDVLNAERDLLLAKVRALDSEATSISNRFSIYAVTGSLGYPLLLTPEAASLIDRNRVISERNQGSDDEF